jgi:hypothetical protein
MASLKVSLRFWWVLRDIDLDFFNRWWWRYGWLMSIAMIVMILMTIFRPMLLLLEILLWLTARDHTRTVESCYSAWQSWGHRYRQSVRRSWTSIGKAFWYNSYFRTTWLFSYRRCTTAAFSFPALHGLFAFHLPCVFSFSSILYVVVMEN